MTKEEAQTFLKRGSFSGSKILYAFSLAYKSKIAVDVVKLLEYLGEDKNGYLYGYIVCTHASNIINIAFHKDIANVTYYDESLASIIEDSIKKAANSTANALPPDDKRLKDIEKIEAYFK